MKQIIILFLVCALGLFSAFSSNAPMHDQDLIARVHEISDNKGQAFSSNPYDYIKAKQAVFDSIVAEGDAAVNVFVNEIRSAKAYGLDKYIMAAACAQITGIGKSGGWSSAKEWLVLYDRESKISEKSTGYVGKYITDPATVYSSFMPELELLKDGTFALNTAIERSLKGTYIVKDDYIVLTIVENTTEIDDSYLGKISLKIQGDNTLVMGIALPEATKAPAVFRRVYASDAEEQAANSKYSIRGSKDGVAEFVALQNQLRRKDATEGNEYSYDLCYNITPREVSDKSDCRIFKYSDSCDSFLLYKGKIVTMGISFGGLGVLDVKVCDLDKDGHNELLYTYSFGSGLHRSHAAHFDLKTKTQTELDYTYLNEDMMIVENPDGHFSLHHANVKPEKNGLIDFDLTAGKHLADIVYENGKVNVLE